MLAGHVVHAQSRSNDAYRPPQDGYQAPPAQGWNSGAATPGNDGYRPPQPQSQAYGGSGGGQAYGGQTYGGQSYGGGLQGGYGQPAPYGAPAARDQAYGGPPPIQQGGYGGGYANQGGQGGYGGSAAPPAERGEYNEGGYGRDGYQRDGGGYANNDQRGGYGQPYSAPPPAYEQAPPPANGRNGPTRGYYEEGEIVEKGRGFFGSITQGLASAIEHTYRKAGRPNGYVLGEDGGGAFFAGLRYGEGVLYTKDAGDHKVFWQGPSLGFDIGGEGSKVMILVYKLSDPTEIYERYAGVEGSTYAVGGVSVQFQKHEVVTLAVIRSGVGLRLGANVGYSKFTRRPTWNPF
ncbi:MAG: DUF1134 domain-containing protein [Hyphomicrobiaceae bacterium]|nr:DUF1134 domain-containing protein [Hyphomicrobiaceae bacterium]